MTESLTREQVREVDRIAIEEFGIPGALLMENAGLGAALLLLGSARDSAGFVGILAGGGNNGGDGYVVARQLANRGVDVRVYATHGADELVGDAGLNRRIVDRMGLPVVGIGTAGELEAASREWRGAGLLVDALLGTGFRGEVRPHLVEVIGALAAAHEATRAPVVALDLPSGLDCDSGRPTNATVRATRTITFVGRKVGFDRPGSEAWTGQVEVVAIGAPDEAVRRARERR